MATAKKTTPAPKNEDALLDLIYEEAKEKGLLVYDTTVRRGHGPQHAREEGLAAYKATREKFAKLGYTITDHQSYEKLTE